MAIERGSPITGSDGSASPMLPLDQRTHARIALAPLTMHEVGLYEPKWRHGKRRVVEPDRLLPAAELEQRVCAAFGCDPEPHLNLSKEVA